ncbi:MAG TPA: EAL domain-containing protein [Geodermatophilus sp.]|nr:EAL domain-containing protein [Geodermatophilus sp.]
MITAWIPGRPVAVPTPRSRRPGVGLVGVLAITAITTALSLAGADPLLQRVGGLAVAASGCLYLLGRADRSVAPAGWRWFAAAVALTSVGGLALPLTTGVQASAVLGIIPGALLTVVGLARLRDSSSWQAGRIQLFTTSTLFVVATLLIIHVLLHLVDAERPGTHPLFRLAVQVVPLVIAVTTTAALLFAGTSDPARQRVAVLLLSAQACSAGASALTVLAWSLSSEALQSWVRPAATASVALLCLACRADVARPTTGPADVRLRVVGVLTSLLPHVTALLGGTLLLLQLTVTGEFDPHGAVLGILGLTALVAHQAVMWCTQRRLAAELLRSESYFRTLVRSSADPVVILDERLRVTFASRALTDLLGLDPDGTLGRPISQAVHPDDAPGLFAALGRRVPAGESAVRTARLRHADGRWRLIQATVRDLREDPDVGALVLYCRDVTPAAPVQGIDPGLLELSLSDPVTGLPNRAALVRQLSALQRGEHTGRATALAFISVTGPDGAAPDLGAADLRALTARLTRVLRGEDWLARSKDGDFAVVVRGSVADAEVLAARLLSAVGLLATPLGTVARSASAGVVALPADVDPGEALRRGDLAARAARAAGPGRVLRYEDALRLEQQRRDALRADLHGALARRELRLVFQPVVDVVLQRTVSVEALLRWRHPVFGEVSPADFVPLAEESALITELGRWVLAEACATVAGLPDPSLAVAVNVSPRQVRSGGLVPDVLAALASSGLPAHRLVVEITESLLLDDADVIDDLEALRRLGVRVAVDDFGTGWSSLAYLVGLPVDVLKLDRHFLADVEHDPQRRALCRSVLQLADSLALPVVVEGVTTQAELTLLRDMGHRYVQGFVFTRPLESADLREGTWPTRPAVAAAPVPAGAG